MLEPSRGCSGFWREPLMGGTGRFLLSATRCSCPNLRSVYGAPEGYVWRGARACVQARLCMHLCMHTCSRMSVKDCPVNTWIKPGLDTMSLACGSQIRAGQSRFEPSCLLVRSSKSWGTVRQALSSANKAFVLVLPHVLFCISLQFSALYL